MAKLRRIDEDEAEDDLESQIWDESSGGDTAKEEDQTKKTSQSSKEVKADLAPPRIRKMSSDVSDQGVFLPDRFNKRRLLRNSKTFLPLGAEEGGPLAIHAEEQLEKLRTDLKDDIF